MRFAFLALCIAGYAGSQEIKLPMKKPQVAKPQCAAGAICFSGEVREGQEFRRSLTPALHFVLKLPGGIDVVPPIGRNRCQLSAYIANPPLRAHHAIEIDAGYGWTAESEVQDNIREFRFVTNCNDFKRLSTLSETDPGKYLEQLPLLAKGQGRLWITDATVTHAHGTVDKKHGAIEWLKFGVEIRSPEIESLRPRPLPR